MGQGEHEHLLEFERKLEAVCDDAELLARVRSHSIQWPSDLWALYALSTLFQADAIVEIGSHFGASMLWLAWCFRASRLVCIDPFAGCSAPAGVALREFAVSVEMAKERLDVDVELLQMESREAAPDFTDESVDLVFVDGFHSEEVVRGDLELYWPKLRKGGILCGHDYCDFHPDHLGVVQAVNAWAEEPNVVLLSPSRVFFVRKGGRL